MPTSRQGAILPRNVRITLRLRKAVAGWFRRQGQDCQSRVNGVLHGLMPPKRAEAVCGAASVEDCARQAGSPLVGAEAPYMNLGDVRDGMSRRHRFTLFSPYFEIYLEIYFTRRLLRAFLLAPAAGGFVEAMLAATGFMRPTGVAAGRGRRHDARRDARAGAPGRDQGIDR